MLEVQTSHLTSQQQTMGGIHGELILSNKEQEQQLNTLNFQIKTITATKEEYTHVNQTLTDELNDNTVEVARLRERCSVHETTMQQVEMTLQIKIEKLTQLEQEHGQLQQLWLNTQQEHKEQQQQQQQVILRF